MLSCVYQTWRGLPATPQKLTPGLCGGWSQGTHIVKKVLGASVPSHSIRGWIGMQLVLASLALLFSMMPDHFFQFHTTQWLLTAVIVLSFTDVAVSAFVNHPNRLSSTLAIQIRTYFGLIRSSFYDAFLYPLVILSIFKIIQNQSYLVFQGNEPILDSKDVWEMTTFSVLGFLYVFIVYFMRLYVYCTAVGRLLQVSSNISCSRRHKTLFLKGFLLHAALQVALQVMLFILISARYQAEHQLRDDSTQFEWPSTFLKVMVAGGMVIPLLALPMYFVSAQKLVEEFPIALLLDSPAHQLTLDTHMDMNKLKRDFLTFHEYNSTFLGGFLNVVQPIFSPIQSLLCGLYTLILMSFFICFSLVHVTEEETGTTQTADAFSTGYYTNVHGMSHSVINATFALALLTTVVTNFIPVFYTIIGTVLLPVNLQVGALWLLAKCRRSRQYITI